jgi:hypothetical protein
MCSSHGSSSELEAYSRQGLLKEHIYTVNPLVCIYFSLVIFTLTEPFPHCYYLSDFQYRKLAHKYPVKCTRTKMKELAGRQNTPSTPKVMALQNPGLAQNYI